MFTDSLDTANEATKLGWNVLIVKMDPMWSSMLQHKWWKMHPGAACPDSHVSLWIDGSMEIIVDDYVGKCLNALGDDDFVTVKHPSRSCIYDEAWFSAQLPRYDAQGLHRQVEYYRSIGQPDHSGLYATGANVRRINAATRELGKHWWWENLSRTHQDQVSLPVILRIMGDRIKWNTNMPWGEWWGIYPHLK